MITFEASIANVPCRVVFADLPEESQRFVVEYGIRQYLNDGAAVSKLHTDKERRGIAKTELEILNEKQDGVTERLANLQSGEFTRRGTGAAKMTPEEKERYSIVQARLDAMAKATGKVLPKKTGKDANPELLQKLHEAMYTKHKDAIDKEVSRRLKAARTEDSDVTDIMDLIG
jgi:hypothetical protein